MSEFRIRGYMYSIFNIKNILSQTVNIELLKFLRTYIMVRDHYKILLLLTYHMYIATCFVNQLQYQQLIEVLADLTFIPDWRTKLSLEVISCLKSISLKLFVIHAWWYLVLADFWDWKDLLLFSLKSLRQISVHKRRLGRDRK